MSIVDYALIVLFFLEAVLCAVFVIKNIKRLVNRALTLFTLSIIGWGGSLLLVEYTGKVFFGETAFAFGALLVFSLPFFAISFPKKKSFPKRYYFLAIPTVFFIGVSFIDGFIFKGIKIVNGSIETGRGVLYPFFVFYALVYFVTGVLVLTRKYKRSVGIERLQIRYLLIGLVLFTFGALMTNVLLPAIGVSQFNGFGPTFSIFFVAFTGYSIIKYRLMDIRIVLRKSFVYLAALMTVVSIGIFLMIFDNRYLDGLIPASVAGPLILLIGVVLFDPVKNFYLEIANRYFFTSLYNYQKTIENITTRLTTIIEIDKIIDMIIETIVKTMKLDRAGVLLLSSNGKEEKCDVAKMEGFDDKNGLNLFSDDPLMRFVEKSRKPVVYDELVRKLESTESEKYKKRIKAVIFNMEKTKISVCLPLSRKKRMIGLIALGDKISKEAYTKEDLDLLAILASQAAVAIENAMLYKEVRNFNETLQARVDDQTREIKDLYEMKSNFLTVASHQLRTPASIIRGMLSMMVEDDFPQEKKDEMIDAAFKSSSSLERVIEDILTAAEIDSAKFDFDPEPVDILPIIERVIEDLSLKAEKKRIDLKFIKPVDKEVKVMTNPMKIEQVFANLIDNAIKYTPKGKVTVSIQKEKRDGKELVVFSCKDNGIGMTRQDLKKIGEKFFRSKNVFAVSPSGTGLGIYIVKRIVKSSQGELEILSEGINKGSEFRVVLKAV